MLMTIIHTFLYALIQTFGVSIYTIALRRLGKIRRLYRLKAFFYLLLVNIAGTMTFGEASWQKTTTPLMAGLFLIGIAFFFASHLYLLYHHARKK